MLRSLRTPAARALNTLAARARTGRISALLLALLGTGTAVGSAEARAPEAAAVHAIRGIVTTPAPGATRDAGERRAGVPTHIVNANYTPSDCRGYDYSHECFPNDNAGPGNPAVQLLNANNQPVAGYVLAFSTNSGVTSATRVVTDASGIAAVVWRFGNTPMTATLTITLESNPSVGYQFVANVVLPTLTKIAGDNLIGTPGTDLSPNQYIRLSDAAGHLAPGYTINWTANGSGGAVSSAQTTTDASGQSGVVWRMPTSGPYTLRACVNTMPGACTTFTSSTVQVPVATTLVNANYTPRDCRGYSYSHQCFILDNAGPGDPAVQLLDQAGHPMAGQTLDLTVDNGGALSAYSVVTDASGIGAVVWHFGPTPGTSTLTYRARSNPSVAYPFIADVTLPVLSKIAGDNVTAAPGTNTTPNPYIRLADAAGRLAPGYSIHWTATGNGQVSSADTPTDANGQASVVWKMPTSGATTLTACVNGMSGVCTTFTATAPPPPPPPVATSLVSANFTTPDCRGTPSSHQCFVFDNAGPGDPAVKLLDQYGQPMVGERISFHPSAGGATSDTSVVTDATGIAAVTWRLGGVPKTDTLTITAASRPSVFYPYLAVVTLPVLTKIAGDQLTALPGSNVATDPAIRLTDAAGRLAPGYSIRWVWSGDGRASSSDTQTDASGQSAVTWRVPTSGAATLTACVVGRGVCTTFAATVALPAVQKIAGDNQSGVRGQPITPADPAVRLVDGQGQPLPGYTVAWATDTSGAVSNPTTVTDAGGYAASRWNVPRSGPPTLTACAAGYNACATFTATVKAPSLTAVSYTPPTCQGAGLPHPCLVRGYAGPNDPAVQLRDTAGAVMAGQTILFSTTHGTVSSESVVTGSDGVAAVRWRFDSLAGTDTLLVRWATDTTVALSFVAVVTMPVVQKIAGDNQSGVRGQLITPADPAIRLVDVYGLALPGYTVNWTTDSTGAVSNPVTTTDAGGYAASRWNLPRRGPVILAACVDGTTACATFSATAAGITTIATKGGDRQTAAAGAALAAPVTVEVRDGNDALLPGASVTFTPANGGSVAPATMTTGANGQASTSWTLGSTAGGQTMTACLSGGSPCVSLAATAKVPGATTLAKVGGDGQTGATSSVLGAPATVEVRDGNNALLAGTVVSFSAANGGSVSAAAVTTDANGRAGTSWTLGSTAGGQAMTACLAGGATCVSFVATASYAMSGGVAVSVRDVNPGATIARDQCLAIAAGDAAAYECGDLRIVHVLPATTTMNKTRAPMLVLDSRHAAPVALIAAAVTARSGTSATSLSATVNLAGHDVTQTYPWTTAMSDDAARRIVVPVDAGSWSLPTGAYPYTMHVSLRDGASTVGDATDTGTVIVVNRSTSPFGAGWWLDGLEQLISVAGHPEQMLWLGGDGNARIYTQATDSVWTAQHPLDGPDTLTKAANGHWMRHLGNEAYTEFDGALRHVATVNRIEHRTTFGYAGAALSTITLPVPPGSAATAAQRTYTFTPTVNGNGLTQSLAVAAPPVNGTARGVTLSYGAATNSWTLAGPDTTHVTIGLAPLGRPVSRTNRRGHTTTFAYDSLGGGTLAQSRLDASSPTVVSIVRGFCAGEAAGLPGTADTFRCAPGPVSLAGVRSTYDGPRTDSSDVTTFALDRLGAVTQVTDAYGHATTLERTDPHWPSLVTKATAPNGHVSLASYDAASGHLLTSTDVGGIFADSSFSTTYVWNTRWDAVERIIPPGKDSTVIGIDPATGDRMWQQDARGAVSRVNFSYDPVTRLVATVTQPGATASDVIAYDATLGNLQQTTTPGGAATIHTRDALGRDSVVTMPTVLASSPRVKQTLTYDLMDRVLTTRSEGPALGYTMLGGRLADSAAVQPLVLVTSNHYDNEGNLLEASALSENSTSDASTTSSSSYDAANRIYDRHTGGNAEAFTYDASGNVIAQQYPGGGTATTAYDRLNRPRARIVSGRDYPRQTCNGFPEGPLSPIGAVCNMVFPYYPNDAAGTGLHVSGDTVTFAYDVAGNMLAADNRNARIRRTYTLGGLLLSDAENVGTVANPRMDYVPSPLSFTYDRSGRRLTMDWDKGTTRYHYTGFGALESVTDPFNNTYHVAYDAEGRQDSLVVLPSGSSTAGVWEKFGYDVEGRLAHRTRTSASPTIGVIRDDILGYDLRGKLTSVQTGGANQSPEQITFAYDGMGAVLAKDQTRGTGEFATEEFRNDAMGNVLYAVTRSSAGINDAPFVSAYEPSGGGRLLTRQTALPQVPTQHQMIDELVQRFAGSNLSTLNHLTTTAPGNVEVPRSQVAERHYYTGDNKLSVIQKYTSSATGTWEEYRYDALGRRVMTRTLRNVASTVDSRYAVCAPPAPCDSYTERSFWDGDHMQYEERARESGSDNVQNNGSVGYVHLLELDKPVAVIRDGEVRVINYDWHGLGESSVHPDGSGADCVFGACAVQIDWPGGGQGGVYYTPSVFYTQGTATPMWLGTLTANGGGTTGALYRRNRYYSTESGQFTQEDPIGLAGGMNLYGFAGGDPVNFSDPFGLTAGCLVLPCPVVFSAAGAASALGPIGWIAAGGLVLAGGLDYLAGRAGEPRLSDRAGADATAYRPGGRFSGKTKGQIDRDATSATGQEGTCEYCGITLVPVPGSPNSTEYDHQKAKSKGGDNSPGNGRRSCRTCNREKGADDVPDPRKPTSPDE